MRSSHLRGAALALAATLLLGACGGGDSPPPKSATGTPLGSVNREAAATDAASLALDGSLALSMSGYYVPGATAVESAGTAPRFSLQALGAVLQRQSQNAPPASAAPLSPLGVAITSTETTNCTRGGSYSVTTGGGSVVWDYAACVDDAGITLNGRVSSLQLDADSYQGDFTAFSVRQPGEDAVNVEGRLIYSSNATATELVASQLRLSMGTLVSLSLTDYLLRLTDEGAQTRIEARGLAVGGGAVAYSVRFDNTAIGDVDQAPFLLADGETYPNSGSLEIQDTLSSSRITVTALNNLQVLIKYMIGTQSESVWKDWSELL